MQDTEFVFIRVPSELLEKLGLPSEIDLPVPRDWFESGNPLGPGSPMERMIEAILLYLELHPSEKRFSPLLKRHFYYQGLQEADKGDPEEGYRCFLKAHKHDSSDPQLLLDLARASFDLGKYQEALEHYQELARQCDPVPLEVLEGLARTLCCLGDKEAGLKVAREAVQRYPARPEALHLLSTLSYHAGDEQTLEHTLFEQLRENPGDWLVLEKIGIYFRESGRLSEAESCFLGALRLSPEEPRLRFQLGLTKIRAGQRDEGVRFLRESLRKDPDYPDAWYALGQAQAESQKWAAAKRSFQQGLARNPEDYRLHFCMAWVCANSRNSSSEHPSTHLQKVLSLGCNELQTLEQVAQISREIGSELLAVQAEERLATLRGNGSP